MRYSSARYWSFLVLLGLSQLLAACGGTDSSQTLSLQTTGATVAGTVTSASTGATTPAVSVSNPTRIATTIGPTASPASTVKSTLAATTTPRPTATPRPAIKPLTGFPGKISLLAEENAIYVSRFDGKDPQLVLGKPGVRGSEEQDGPVYAWPTWNRDGTKLAVMSFNYVGGAVSTSDVYVIGADGKNPLKVQDASPDRPIFVSWSPDGTMLSELVSASTQLELRLLEPGKGAASQNLRKIASGSSIYTGWSPDSQQLLIHSSDAGAETVALLSAKDLKAQAVPFKVNPGSFRSPAFSQDGARLSYSALNPQTGFEDITIQDKSGSTLGQIETGGRGATFSWSPSGNRLAHSYMIAGGQGLYKGIFVSELDSKPGSDGKFGATQLVNEPIIAFFWSPDGKKLAYAGFNNAQDLLTWKIYDFDSKKSSQITEWFPSHETIQMLQYYDQYAQSNSVWSPDSKALVFSGYSKEDVLAITKSGDQSVPAMIYVLPVSGAQSGQLLPVAVGGLAYWSK